MRNKQGKKKDFKADIKEIKDTLNEITEALYVNEDLQAKDENRLSKLKNIDVIKDTLSESEILYILFSIKIFMLRGFSIMVITYGF